MWTWTWTWTHRIQIWKFINHRIQTPSCWIRMRKQIDVNSHSSRRWSWARLKSVFRELSPLENFTVPVGECSWNQCSGCARGVFRAGSAAVQNQCPDTDGRTFTAHTQEPAPTTCGIYIISRWKILCWESILCRENIVCRGIYLEGLTAFPPTHTYIYIYIHVYIYICIYLYLDLDLDLDLD